MMYYVINFIVQKNDPSIQAYRSLKTDVMNDTVGNFTFLCNLSLKK